jgi:hypothetical protein
VFNPRRNLLLVFPLVLIATAAAAQSAEPLFVTRSAAAERGNQDAVGMRLDRLFAPTTDRVWLNVADHDWIATVERLESAAFGHRVWVGRIENLPHSHVSFAERDGVVSGLINALSDVYQVRTITPGAYRIERVAAEGAELPPLVDYSNNIADEGAAAPAAAADERGTIDVLLLYTARAVTRVGGTAQMQALVAQIITDSNTIFSRSGITTRLRLAGSQEFTLAETASMSTDLTTLTNSTTARELRDQYRADLVQLLEETNQSGVCGIAWLLTSLSNTNFNGYSVADVDCASQYTPTHEMGHNMGSHHAPEDEASFALFPYSFGYKDPARGFRTVMAYACSGATCPRIPSMSNPSLAHNGGVTGTATQNNALSINNAAETVANFRQAAAAPTPAPTPPNAPTGLRSQVNANVVTLSWNAAPTATSYVLNVGNAPGVANLYAGSVGAATSLTGSVANGTYFWRVVAQNAAGQGPASAESSFTVGPSTCVVPSAPQTFVYSLVGRVVTLSWAAPATGTAPLSYVIEVGSATALANLFNSGVGPLTALSVQAPSGTFFVRVRALNACGLSSASQEQMIVVP